MTPVHFPEANAIFGAPSDMAESQVATVHAFKHQLTAHPGHQHNVLGGSCDGATQVVVAWQLSPEEIERLKQNNGVIFLSVLGGLIPHYLSLDFFNATHPA
jgi:hypothetical protein